MSITDEMVEAAAKAMRADDGSFIPLNPYWENLARVALEAAERAAWSAGANESSPNVPYAFVQWKGTDVCMDFHCDCGADCHFDGYFASEVKCPHCNAIWEMPIYAVPRKAAPDSGYAKMLEPDEENSDEVTGDDGITRFVPRLLPTPPGEGE